MEDQDRAEVRANILAKLNAVRRAKAEEQIIQSGGAVLYRDHWLRASVRGDGWIDYAHVDWDLDDRRHGAEPSIAAAKAQIDERIEDEAAGEAERTADNRHEYPEEF